MMHKIRAELQAGGRGNIWIDDVPIYARAITIDASAGSATSVKITLGAVDCDITGEMDIDMVVELLKNGKIQVTGV